MILGFLIWKYCCNKKQPQEKVLPQSFKFVEEFETFEKKKEEKNLHVNTQNEDSGRSSICEMIQNFSDRLDRNELSERKNSFTSEFLIHHAGSKGYFDEIEEEEESLSSDDGKFIFAKEEKSLDKENVAEGSQRCQTVDNSSRMGGSEDLKTNNDMINVEIHLTDDFYRNNRDVDDLLREENFLALDHRTFDRERKSSKQNSSSSFTLSSEYENSNLSSDALHQAEDYYKYPSTVLSQDRAQSEKEFRNARQYRQRQVYYQSSDTGPQYVNFTFPRASIKRKSSFHKNVPKVVRFNEEM